MQPLYCTWEANGTKAHTPGSMRNGRVVRVEGWINSALGELARIEVTSCGEAAAEQSEVTATIKIPSDAIVVWDRGKRALIVKRSRALAAVADPK